MSGSYTNKMNIHLEELEEAVSLLKRLGGNQCTLYQDGSSGIGYLLMCGVHIEKDGIKGELIVPITDESSW